MQINQVSDTYKALVEWTAGHGAISTIEFYLGDTSNLLTAMLYENNLVDAWGKPNPDYSQQALVDIVLLYLAMRHG